MGIGGGRHIVALTMAARAVLPYLQRYRRAAHAASTEEEASSLDGCAFANRLQGRSAQVLLPLHRHLMGIGGWRGEGRRCIAAESMPLSLSRQQRMPDCRACHIACAAAAEDASLGGRTMLAVANAAAA